MEQPSSKLTKILFLFIVGVFIIKSANNAGFFEAKNYKGKGYYVDIPVGWKKVKKQKGAVYPEGVAVVMFVPKGTDLKKGEPDAYISIFTKKLTSAVWIEDEFPNILASVRSSGYQIMDKGDIKIGGEISKWMVYRDEKTPALVLEFYIITDANVFYKIQYSAHPDKFNELRKSFEELKESFKFKFILY